MALRPKISRGDGAGATAHFERSTKPLFCCFGQASTHAFYIRANQRNKMTEVLLRSK